MDFLKELENNLIDDFEEYLQENNLEISCDWIINNNYINNYLMSIFYNLQDNLETVEEVEKIQDKFYEILDNYCCQLPF